MDLDREDFGIRGLEDLGRKYLGKLTFFCLRIFMFVRDGGKIYHYNSNSEIIINKSSFKSPTKNKIITTKLNIFNSIIQDS